MMLAWIMVLGLAAGDEQKATPPGAVPLDQNDRINKLEADLQKLKAENAARQLGLPVELSLEEQDKAAKPAESEFKVSFTDGFHLKTSDGNFDLHIGGRWLEEFRYTFGRNNTSSNRTAVNTFYTREAFISVDGTLFHDFGFKLNGDFTPPQTAGVATGAPAGTLVSAGAIVEEAFVEWKSFKELRLLFGQFKAPVSFETTDSPRFSEMIQRSPMARFLPNIDTGLKLHGTFSEGLLAYELAVTNGRSHLANTGRNNIDDNDGLEWSVRLSTSPFIQDKESSLKGLRVGVYSTYALEGRGPGTTATGFPGNISTHALGTNYFQFANAGTLQFHGGRWRLGGELTYSYGPFMVRGEIMERMDFGTQTVGAVTAWLRTIGYYAEATFVVTGEDRLPNARIVPLHNLNLAEGTFGAVELALRYGGVNLDNNALTTLTAASAGNSNGARDLTFGVNWWLCPNVKICADYVREMFNTPLTLNSVGPARKHAEGFLMRFQVDF